LCAVALTAIFLQPGRAARSGSIALSQAGVASCTRWVDDPRKSFYELIFRAPACRALVGSEHHIPTVVAVSAVCWAAPLAFGSRVLGGVGRGALRIRSVQGQHPGICRRPIAAGLARGYSDAVSGTEHDGLTIRLNVQFSLEDVVDLGMRCRSCQPAPRSSHSTSATSGRGTSPRPSMIHRERRLGASARDADSGAARQAVRAGLNPCIATDVAYPAHRPRRRQLRGGRRGRRSGATRATSGVQRLPGGPGPTLRRTARHDRTARDRRVHSELTRAVQSRTLRGAIRHDPD
jgi:hypothetical protein